MKIGDFQGTENLKDFLAYWNKFARRSDVAEQKNWAEGLNEVNVSQIVNGFMPFVTKARVLFWYLTYVIAVKFFSRYEVRENFDRKVIFSGSFQSSEHSEQSRTYIKRDISF